MWTQCEIFLRVWWGGGGRSLTLKLCSDSVKANSFQAIIDERSGLFSLIFAVFLWYFSLLQPLSLGVKRPLDFWDTSCSKFQMFVFGMTRIDFLEQPFNLDRLMSERHVWRHVHWYAWSPRGLCRKWRPHTTVFLDRLYHQGRWLFLIPSSLRSPPSYVTDN